MQVVATDGGLVFAEVLADDALGGIAEAVEELILFATDRADGKHTIHFQVFALGKATWAGKVVGVVKTVVACADQQTSKADGFVRETLLGKGEMLAWVVGHEMHILACDIEPHLYGIGRYGTAIDGIFARDQ